MISAPRPVRGGSTTTRSGRLAVDCDAEIQASTARTASPVVPARLARAQPLPRAPTRPPPRGRKFCREPSRKQAHSREQIPGQCAAVSGGHLFHQRIHQPAIHLEECTMINAIIDTRNAILKGSLRPIAQSCVPADAAPSITSSAPASSGTRSFIAIGEFIETNLCGTCDKHRQQQRRFIRVAEERQSRSGGVSARTTASFPPPPTRRAPAAVRRSDTR